MPSRQFLHSWDLQLSVVLISCNMKVFVSQRIKGGQIVGEAVQVTLTDIIRGLTEKYALQVSKKTKINTEKKEKPNPKSPAPHTRSPSQKVLFQLIRRKGGSLESTEGSIKSEICAL